MRMMLSDVCLRAEANSKGNGLDKHAFLTRKSTVFVLATLCCLLWGSAYPAIKNGYAMFGIAPTDVPAKMLFAGYRFLFAGIALLIFAVATGRRIFQPSAANWRDATILGLGQTSIQYVFFYVGLAYTTGVKGSIMNATSTFFSVLLAHFIYHDDRLSPFRITGCLIGFVGVMVVNFSKDLLDFHFTLMGEGFVVISAFMLSAGGIFGKRISQRMDSVVLTGHQLTIGGAVLILAGYVTGGTLYMPSVSAAVLMAYMVALSSVAFAVWTILLKHNRVGMVAVFNFLIPVFGTVLSALFLDESIMEWKNALALVLVCGGIWLVTREEAPVRISARDVAK